MNSVESASCAAIPLKVLPRKEQPRIQARLDDLIRTFAEIDRAGRLAGNDKMLSQLYVNLTAFMMECVMLAEKGGLPK